MKSLNFFLVLGSIAVQLLVFVSLLQPVSPQVCCIQHSVAGNTIVKYLNNHICKITKLLLQSVKLNYAYVQCLISMV